MAYWDQLWLQLLHLLSQVNDSACAWPYMCMPARPQSHFVFAIDGTEQQTSMRLRIASAKQTYQETVLLIKYMKPCRLNGGPSCQMQTQVQVMLSQCYYHLRIKLGRSLCMYCAGECLFELFKHAAERSTETRPSWQPCRQHKI